MNRVAPKAIDTTEEFDGCFKLTRQVEDTEVEPGLLVGIKVTLTYKDISLF